VEPHHPFAVLLFGPDNRKNNLIRDPCFVDLSGHFAVHF
jgi:hypothetical protein